VLLLLGYLSSYTTIEEGYVSTSPLAWEEFNKLNPACPRDLVFPKFIDAQYNASERAQLSEMNPTGTCDVSLTSPVLAMDYSIVEENTMTYILKSLCLNLNHDYVWRFANRHVAFRVPKPPKNMNIVPATYNASDLLPVLTLLALNPLYVEFDESIAYVLNKQIHSCNFVTNYYGNGLTSNQDTIQDRHFELHFIPLLNGQQASNAVFSKRTKQVVESGNPNGKSNVRTFYLDGGDTSGRRLTFPNSTNQSKQLIFNKAYGNLPKDSDAYFFSQRIFVMLTNGKYPIFNFKFDIHVNKQHEVTLSGQNRKQEIFKMYMEHPEYQYGSCTFEPLGIKNNNVVSAILEGYNTVRGSYKLSFVTGKNKTSCNYRSNDNELEIELPYVQNTERISILLSVSPTEKIVLAQWAIQGIKYVTFKRSTLCDNTSNFARIFTKTDGVPRIENMYAEYDNNYVRSFDYIHLGHMNMMSEFTL